MLVHAATCALHGQPPGFAPGWNGLAKTPPLGWRSWNGLGPSITQADIEANIDALGSRPAFANESLRELGYARVGIDEGWEGCGEGVNGTQHDADGRPVIDTTRFANMSALVAKGHAAGFLMGWYQNGCACGERTEVARNCAPPQALEDTPSHPAGPSMCVRGGGADAGDIASLAELEFDAVKYDGCGAMNNMTRYAQLMQATGKAFEVEDCKAGDCSGEDTSGCPSETWCPFNHYRVSRDIDNTDTRWFLNLQSAVRFLAPHAPLSRPHCWAYGDMLEVGRLSTFELNRAHFGAWCVISSPLFIGFDLRLRRTLEWVWPILSNKVALRINQAYVGHPGRLVKQWAPRGADAPKAVDAAPQPGSTGAEYARLPWLPRRAPRLFATMLYPACNASDPTQGKWSYDAASPPRPGGGGTVRFGSGSRVRCLDRTSPGALELRPCNRSSAQQNFACGVGSDGHCQLRAPGSGLCVDANDWNGANVFMAECNDMHYASSQRFRFDSDGQLSSLQAAFAGPLRRCIAALPEPTTPDPMGAPEEHAAPALPLQLWAKPQPHGGLAVLVLNMLPAGSGAELVHLDLADDLNLTSGPMAAFDVWEHSALGSAPVTSLELRVPPRDSRFVLLSRPTTEESLTEDPKTETGDAPPSVEPMQPSDARGKPPPLELVEPPRKSAPPPPCSTRLDCSLNGACVKGACMCEAAWTGDHCEQLSLRSDAPSTLGYHGTEGGARLSSWGGSVHRGAKSGEYHLLASEIAPGAGMMLWECASRIIHATSANPLTTPFVKRRVLWAAFSHEPRCAFEPAGGLVCYFSHWPGRKLAGACNGTDGSTPVTGCGCAGAGGGAMATVMSHIADLDDPSAEWSAPVAIGAIPPDPDSNLAPVILPNGSVHALVRSNSGSNIHVLTAALWSDVASYTYYERDLPDQIHLPEDPFLWRDAHGGWHSLHHAYPNPSGTHAFSTDGWTWRTYWPCRRDAAFWKCNSTAGDAYLGTATFADRTIRAGCRERPSLAFAADGVTPIALLNGLAPDPFGVNPAGGGPSGSCRYATHDYAFTALQPLRTGE